MTSHEVDTKSGQRRSLVGMLAMGVVTVWGVCELLNRAFGIDYVKEVIMQPQLGKTVFGPETGVNGDLVMLSLCYVPLMIITIGLRNAGVGKAVLSLKTPYNVVMTAFSAWCFVVMALWRFGPEFPGLTAGNCATALDAATSVGSFRTASALFFWSKYVE